MKNILCSILLLLFILSPGYSYAQTDSIEQARQDSLAITEADDFVTASILVATPSDVLYSCAGHACIRMQCPHYGLDMVYTYESESVTDKVLTFLKGDLKMGMTSVPTGRVLADYDKEGRGITEYVLNIPLEKRKQLWQYLDEKVAQGMNLPYDYLKRGCAVTCLQAICAAVQPDTLSFGEWDEKFIKKTRRTLLNNQIENFPWARFIFFLTVGVEADQPCAIMQKVVVPNDLIDVLKTTTFKAKPVLGEAKTLVSQTISIKESCWFTPIMLACFLLLLAIVSCFWMQKPLSIFLLVVQLVLGVFITYLIVFSTLPNISFSWLIIPLNPLPILFWCWRKWWLLPLASIFICWSFAMLVHIGNPLVDNAYIVLALALAVNYIGQWNQLRKDIKFYK